MIRGKTTLQQCAPLAGEYQKVLFCNIEATEEETNNAGNIAAMCSAGREQLLREGIDQVCQGAAHWDTRLDTAHCKLEYCAVYNCTLGYCAVHNCTLGYSLVHCALQTRILRSAKSHTGLLALRCEVKSELPLQYNILHTGIHISIVY